MEEKSVDEEEAVDEASTEDENQSESTETETNESDEKDEDSSTEDENQSESTETETNESDEKDEDSSSEGTAAEPEEIPEEKKLAPAAEIKELAKALGKVAGLPPNIVIPPMNNEQVAISKTPAADIPPTKLFVPVPLAARMTSGV